MPPKGSLEKQIEGEQDVVMQVTSTSTGLAPALGQNAGNRALAQNERRVQDGASVKVTASSVEQAPVRINLSQDALLYLSKTKPASATDNDVIGNALFFPVREGFDAGALAEAVSDPAAESSSAGKTLAQAAVDARASMDANYAAMNASGDPFNPDSFEARDWNSVMGNLDRRSLLAIRENTGGLFTELEQSRASDMMIQQLALATGSYYGPAGQADKFLDPFGDNHVARGEATIAWLGQVSDDERMTGAWLGQQFNATSFLNDVKDEDRDEDDLHSKPRAKSLLEILAQSLRESRENLKGQQEEDAKSPLGLPVLGILDVAPTAVVNS